MPTADFRDDRTFADREASQEEMKVLQVSAGLVLVLLLGVTGWAVSNFGFGPVQPAAPAPVPAAASAGPNQYAGFEVKNEAEDLTILGVSPDGSIRFCIRPEYHDKSAVYDCTVYAIMIDSFGDRISPNPGVHFGTVPAGEAREGSLPIPPGAVRARIRTNGTWAPAP